MKSYTVNYNECRVCKSTFPDDKSFNSHLRGHKTTVKDYFELHYPRTDMLTNEKIPYKDRGSLNKNFVDKGNLKEWIGIQDNQTAGDYCEEILTRRKREKSLIYTPTQIELRSLGFPSIVTYNRLHKDYYDLCGRLGFRNKHLQLTEIDKNIFNMPHALDPNPTQKPVILIDTREQQPLNFEFETKVQKLPYGDYALEGDDDLCIERKSLEDFVGTMGPKNLDRFIREIERAGANDTNIVVVVDSLLDECMDFDLSAKSRGKARITPEYIFHNVRELLQSYPFLQFLFVNGRKRASRVIEKILYFKPTDIDLQLAYDYRLFS